MTEQIDNLAPAYIGEDRFILSINSSSLPLLALSPTIVDVDYSDVDDEGGIELPIEFMVTPSSIDNIGFVRRVYRKYAPTSITFTPLVAGVHLILVKECCHNLWQGRLVVTVGGDEADKTDPLDRI
jgi:hypothetical protein